MTSANPEETRPNGQEPGSRPHFSTAEDVNPPLPGSPGYEDYVARRAEWMLSVDQQRAQTPRPEVTPTTYFDASLGRRVTPDDPAPGPRPQPPEEAPALEAGSEDRLDLGPDADIGGQSEDRIWRRTDAANGEYFARIDGDRVRFDHRRRHWLMWGGHWWRDDDTDAVRRLAKEAARQRYREALEIEDLEERSQESRHAIRSESRSRLDAMLFQARSEPPIADGGDRWDRDPWLLGVANGVVGLRSGRLRQGSPDDRITLHTNVTFDPTGRRDLPSWMSHPASHPFPRLTVRVPRRSAGPASP